MTNKYISLNNGLSYKENKDTTITYYCSFRDKDNKVKRKKLFKKDNHSQKHIREAILKSEEIKNEDKEEKKQVEIMTLNKLAENYFTMRRAKTLGQLRRKYNHLNEEDFYNNVDIKTKIHRTKAHIGFYYKNISNSKLAKMNIEDITVKIFSDYVDKHLNTKHLSEKSVYDLVSLLKTICNYNIISGEITNNPFTYFKIAHPHRKRQRYLSIEELELLLKTAKEYTYNKNVYMAIYLGVLTAGRARTVLSIRKKDIDFTNRKILLDNFKTNKLYNVVITKKASEWLEKITEDLNPSDYLIHKKYQAHNPLRSVPVKIYTIMDELFNKDLNKKNNFDRDQVVNFHTLRRSIATNMALQKIDIYKIMLFLNHSNIKQTQDYLNLQNMNISNEVELLHEKIFKNF